MLAQANNKKSQELRADGTHCGVYCREKSYCWVADLCEYWIDSFKCSGRMRKLVYDHHHQHDKEKSYKAAVAFKQQYTASDWMTWQKDGITISSIGGIRLHMMQGSEVA
jgi:hypothetical protein